MTYFILLFNVFYTTTLMKILVSYIHKDLLHLKSVLEQERLLLIQWFDKKFMKAYPDKFQAICIGNKIS